MKFVLLINLKLFTIANCFLLNMAEHENFSANCYDWALLPSIICLGRLRIVSKYIFNLWQLRQGVDSLAQRLEHWIFNWEDQVRFPWQARDFFSYASIPLLRLSCREMGAGPKLDFIHLKWLQVIMNDDFLEERGCYDRALLPSIICLGRLRIVSKYTCIFNLWQLRQGVDSLAQWLEHWIFNREDRVWFPWQAWDFFSYASIPLLRLSCCKTINMKMPIIVIVFLFISGGNFMLSWA